MIARLTLAYVGTRFAGWQRQPNAATVQEGLERALARLTGVPEATVAEAQAHYQFALRAGATPDKRLEALLSKGISTDPKPAP